MTRPITHVLLQFGLMFGLASGAAACKEVDEYIGPLGETELSPAQPAEILPVDTLAEEIHMKGEATPGTPADDDAPTVTQRGDTMTVRSADGRSTVSITQDGAAYGAAEVRQDGNVTIIQRRSASGSVMILQSSGD